MPKVYQDLRSFLGVLEEEGQLVHIANEVDPDTEIGAAGRAASRIAGGPAVMFEHINGYPKGQRVVTNVHGSWANHALMMGMDKNTSTKDQFFELNRRWDLFPVKPNVVSRDEAPCKENVIEEGAINLFDLLPLYRINEQDAGCFISKASIITADPSDTGNFDKTNVGTYRIQVKGKDRIGMQCLAMHDIAKQLWEAEKRDEPFPVCIALGNAPLVTFMASTPISYTQNEYEFVGALNGGVPADIVKSDLYDHLYVPAGAEVVLEGYIVPRLRTVEGPFGEFPGSYSGSRLQCEAKITHVTYRTDPIFENLYLGMPWSEIDYLMALNTSVPIYKQLKVDFPEIVAVNAMYTHGMTEIISMKPRYGGQATGAAFRLLSTPHGMPYCHNVIVVDDVVDPFDLDQVMWALSTRVRPDKDVKVVPNCAGMPLNPTEEVPGITAKLIIDATTPVDPEPMKRSVELLKDPAKTAEYGKIIKDLMGAR